MFHPATPPKFKVLVAAITSPSDPSRGINPTIARTGFTLQQVITQSGVGRVGGPIVARAATGPLNHTAAIVVTSNDFANSDGVAPFLLTEEIALFDRYIVAGQNFSVAGGGVAPLDEIADGIAVSLNVYPDIDAVSDGVDTVYITYLGLEPFLPIKATGDESETLGDAPFEITAGGVTLTVSPALRQTFYVSNSVKTQSPPEALP